MTTNPSTPSTAPPPGEQLVTAFKGPTRIAAGPLRTVVAALKERIGDAALSDAQVFDDRTGVTVEVDYRGSLADVLDRIDHPSANAPPPAESARSRGRPRLGVIAREVTLLPRHWDWLHHQPGGASVALRKLVDEARKANVDNDAIRQAHEAAFRFMSTTAGSLPGFEEALRALFAGSAERFDESTQTWPADLRAHARQLADAAFASRPKREHA